MKIIKGVIQKEPWRTRLFLYDHFLIAPAGLIIAVTVVCELPDVAAVRAHDEYFAGVQILFSDIRVGSKGDPLAIGGKACPLSVDSCGRNPVQIAAIGVH